MQRDLPFGMPLQVATESDKFYVSQLRTWDLDTVRPKGLGLCPLYFIDPPNFALGRCSDVGSPHGGR